MLVKPNEIRHPTGMRVARDDDRIVNIIFIEGLKCPVPVGLIAVPSIPEECQGKSSWFQFLADLHLRIIIHRVDITVGCRLIDTREHRLTTYDPPSGTPFL